jgi:hypothetical protein
MNAMTTPLVSAKETMSVGHTDKLGGAIEHGHK